MKVGVLGGTFDPIHSGHLVAGEEARCALGLERVLFVPSARPPHKLDYRVSPPEERVEMVRLAIADNPAFELSTVDLDRPGYSYTVDTVALLQEKLGPRAKLYFILGEDALADLPTWHKPERLLETCELIAVNDGTDADRPLCARHLCQIDLRVGDALADPAVFHRPVAHARDPFLMQLVVEK